MNQFPGFALSLGLALVFSGLAMADDQSQALTGLWKHETQPVVVKMKSADGLIQGIIVREDEKPDAVGKTLFRNLKYDADAKSWKGQVFVLKLEEEKAVSIVLKSAAQFVMTVKAGLITKKVSWNRVDSVAPQQPQVSGK